MHALETSSSVWNINVYPVSNRQALHWSVASSCQRKCQKGGELTNNDFLFCISLYVCPSVCTFCCISAPFWHKNSFEKKKTPQAAGVKIHQSRLRKSVCICECLNGVHTWLTLSKWMATLGFIQRAFNSPDICIINS